MADAWGIEHRFVNSRDEPQRVSDDTVASLRAALGDPEPTHGPLVTRVGSQVDLGAGEVILEDGTSISARDAGRGRLPAGYHTLVETSGESRTLIVSPGRCHLPPELRTWGWVSQLYGMRSDRSWGVGDLTDLRRLAEWSSSLGAGFTMISPVVAAAPTSAQEPNPYFPATRRFRNPIYLAISEIPGAELVAEYLEPAERAARELNRVSRVDRGSVWEAKLSALEAIWQAGPPLDSFERWMADQPDSLKRFATWSVLTEQHGRSWQNWPGEFRRPDADPVTATESIDSERVKFHCWLQWCLEQQLTRAGEVHAIIQDLPIGFDPGGFDAWEWQDLLAMDLTVGAPPDAFNQEGQDWGSPPFIPWRLRSAGYRPFIETIRANLTRGGGLRIDHVMGLFRLWCVPGGSSPADGAYVRYPAEDLLAILALESQRAGAIIVGEDLGTVEEGVRPALSEHDMLSYRLLWFESGTPEHWPEKSMAAVTTHDLPTIAGLWEGSDAEEQRELGLQIDDRGIDRIRRTLAESTSKGDLATTDEVVMGAYARLAKAPSRLLAATLEDAVGAETRPNMPGATGRDLNWRLTLPVSLEEMKSLQLPNRLAAILDEATENGNGDESDE